MVRARSPGQSLFKAVLAVLLIAGSGFAVASIMAGGPAKLLARDPALADYTWLRQGLERAQTLSDRALEGTRRSGRLAAARALEQMILYSRATARRTETRPIPRNIRERLEGYFPEHVLDKVRWAFPNRYLDLGTLVAWHKAEGGAVTLLDTIIYASRVGVESEYLWAHELTHVMQYEQLGLRDFARIYTTHPELLERQARENGNRIVRELRALDRARVQAEAEARARAEAEARAQAEAEAEAGEGEEADADVGEEAEAA